MKNRVTIYALSIVTLLNINAILFAMDATEKSIATLTEEECASNLMLLSQDAPPFTPLSTDELLAAKLLINNKKRKSPEALVSDDGDSKEPKKKKLRVDSEEKQKHEISPKKAPSRYSLLPETKKEKIRATQKERRREKNEKKERKKERDRERDREKRELRLEEIAQSAESSSKYHFDLTDTEGQEAFDYIMEQMEANWPKFKNHISEALQVGVCANIFTSFDAFEDVLKAFTKCLLEKQYSSDSKARISIGRIWTPVGDAVAESLKNGTLTTQNLGKNMSALRTLFKEILGILERKYNKGLFVEMATNSTPATSFLARAIGNIQKTTKIKGDPNGVEVKFRVLKSVDLKITKPKITQRKTNAKSSSSSTAALTPVIQPIIPPSAQTAATAQPLNAAIFSLLQQNPDLAKLFLARAAPSPAPLPLIPQMQPKVPAPVLPSVSPLPSASTVVSEAALQVQALLPLVAMQTISNSKH